jgi:wyosine [tRNA(Phe)-imidazoG37] synthetase (radical SAM superfamily)
MTQKLTINDHSRDSAGLKYVYPAMSRRSGGLSIGINFNINSACNWRCIYCQVPNLMRGTAPEMDFQLLEQELRLFLTDVLHGDFYDRFEIAPELRVIKDIAISGNGEPTSLVGFEKAIGLIGEIATELGVLPLAKFVLISNGSLMHQTKVQLGLKQLNRYRGQVWFKLDSATEGGRKQINNTEQSAQKALAGIISCSQLCETKIQTCVVNYDDQNLVESEKTAYLDFLKQIKNRTNITEVMLYTIARPSFQPEAVNIAKLDTKTMNEFANEISQIGYQVSVNG